MALTVIENRMLVGMISMAFEAWSYCRNFPLQLKILPTGILTICSSTRIDLNICLRKIHTTNVWVSRVFSRCLYRSFLPPLLFQFIDYSTSCSSVWLHLFSTHIYLDGTVLYKWYFNPGRLATFQNYR